VASALTLIALQVLLSLEERKGGAVNLSGLLGGITTIVTRALDPAVPAIPSLKAQPDGPTPTPTPGATPTPQPRPQPSANQAAGLGLSTVPI
jgi:hypothetical protein